MRSRHTRLKALKGVEKFMDEEESGYKIHSLELPREDRSATCSLFISLCKEAMAVEQLVFILY